MGEIGTSQAQISTKFRRGRAGCAFRNFRLGDNPTGTALMLAKSAALASNCWMIRASIAVLSVVICTLSAIGQSAAASAPRKSDSTPALSGTDAQRLLEGPCQLVTSTAQLPEKLRVAFAILTVESEFALANPGDKYQSTDVMTRPKLPLRRMVIAGNCGGYWFIHYERGGLGHSYAIVFFQPDSKGEMAFVWGGRGFYGASNCAELRNAIASKKFAEDHPFYW